jgi:hypothetical protein
LSATAEGRLAAFAEGPLPDQSVDWALATVFIAESLAVNGSPEYVPVAVADKDWADLEKRIESYQLLREPVFCGREEFFEAYYNLFTDRPVLLIHTPSAELGVGRTRLLHELAAQALRDGHVPCLVGCSATPADDSPTTVGQLGIAVLKAIGGARKVFKLGPPLDSQLIRTLGTVGALPNSQGRKVLEEEIGDPWSFFERLMAMGKGLPRDAVTAGDVRAALEVDLACLIAEVRAKRYDLRLMSSVNDVSGIPTEGKNLVIVATVATVDDVLHFRIFDGDGKEVVHADEKTLQEQTRQIADLRKQLQGLWPPHELTRSEEDRVITAVTSIVGPPPHGLPVVLLDNVDRYGEELTTALLDTLLGAEGARGLGTAADERPRVPVIMTFSHGGPQDGIWERVVEKTRSYLTLIELKPFERNGEDLLACERVLLYPPSKAADLWRDIPDAPSPFVPWAVNDRAGEQVIRMSQGIFRHEVRGLPIRLGKEGFYEVASLTLRERYLLEANDEEKLLDYLRKAKAPWLSPEFQ